MQETAELIAVTVNGRERDLPEASTIADLLQSLDIDPRMVVVEHNREILRDREAYAQRTLASGDNVEIVHFVGGG